jgi:methyl-accepting chemotaxis protein
MKDLKISTRLIILVLITSAITLSVGLYGVQNLTVINDGMTTMYNDRIVPLKQLKEVSDAYAVSIVDASHKARNGNVSWNEAAYSLERADKIIDDNLNAYGATQMDGEELRLYNESKNLRVGADEAYNEILGILHQGKDSASQKKLTDYIITSLYPKIDPFTNKISELIDIQLTIADKVNSDADELYASTRIYTYMLIFIAILFSSIVAYFIISNVNSSLRRANDVISKLAEGDLTQKIKDISKDEIGQLLGNIQGFIEKLKSIVGNIISSADNIADASNAMSGASQQMSQGTQEQAASAEEISASMEQMAANIEQNTDNALQTEKIAIKSAEEMKEGSAAVTQTVDSMKKIADKIGIIGEIARQTNLLALNAAVEAARAGEQGKGFAVVAAEVRKLAERSQVAAEEINGLSSSSVTIADKSGRLLEQLVPNIQNTAKLVQEITAASSEQSGGATQINNAIQQFNQVIQQNAAGAEEMAASSEELAAQADNLLGLISFFDIDKQSAVKKATTTHKPTQFKTAHFPSPSIKSSGNGTHKNVVINLDKKDNVDHEYQKF